MISFDNGGILIENVNELPKWAGSESVLLDFETTSGNHKLDSTNPHNNCKIAGFAITVDDCPDAYYVDYMRLSDFDKGYVAQWLGEIMYAAKHWINHNIKYDAHVYENELDRLPSISLVCTLTLAKIIDSDRIVRGGYGLDALARDWLGHDIAKYEKALQPYLGKHNKDYGNIPPDILGEYGCEDVLSNRRLYNYISANCPEQCYGVWATEIELTSNIFQMERNGLRVDPQELKLAEFTLLNRMCAIDEELAAIVGRSFRPHVSGDVYEILCGQYGLPILAFTKDEVTGEDTGNPSFDKHALAMYAANPQTPKDVLGLIMEYKTLSQRLGLFIQPWQDYMIYDEEWQIYILRSTYNQCVRTGRMSASEPNAQQLDKYVKQLIRPKPGYAFISSDYSQIEFRFIGHYIQSPIIIDAYKADPDADFHKIVANWCEIKRKPAKSVNFGVAFGEGKKKLIKQLATNIDLVEKIGDEVKRMVEFGSLPKEFEARYFQQLAEKRWEDVYNRYHKTFPTLKSTARAAENVLRSRGFVFNMYGRHRHLPKELAYRTFNTLNQSSAADLIKERTNEVCRQIAGTPIELSALVHDEMLLQAPIEIAYDPRTSRDLAAIMEHPTIENDLRVPIRCAVGISSKHWAEACADTTQKPVHYNLAEATNFSFLK